MQWMCCKVRWNLWKMVRWKLINSVVAPHFRQEIKGRYWWVPIFSVPGRTHWYISEKAPPLNCDLIYVCTFDNNGHSQKPSKSKKEYEVTWTEKKTSGNKHLHPASHQKPCWYNKLAKGDRSHLRQERQDQDVKAAHNAQVVPPHIQHPETVQEAKQKR